MKLLNLDELSPVGRGVTIKGITYDVADQSVAGMIMAIQIAERTQTSSGSAEDTGAMFRDMMELVSQILVDCPKEVVASMSMKQMNALLEFASASDAEVVQGSEDTTEGEKKS